MNRSVKFCSVLLPNKTQYQNSYFCMADLRNLIRSGKFSRKGTIYQDSNLTDYHLGKPVGNLDIAASDVDVLVNRNLNSLMNPVAVAKEVLGK